MKVSIGHKAHFKIVFAGSFGVGKTTAIKNISDIPVVDTDVQSSEITQKLQAEGKTTTTVGFDYGEVFLPDDQVIALYGLPGQERFNQVWEHLLTENTAVILWIDGSLDNAHEICAEWLKTLHEHDATSFLTIVITRAETPLPKEVLREYRELVGYYNAYAPIITGDARNKNQVMQAVLMSIADPELESGADF